MMGLRVALPKGRLLEATAHMLEKSGWRLEDYSSKARLYRIKSERWSDIAAKMFHEKDIPIQVAIGNYDLGFCGFDWFQEQLVKFPSSALVRLMDLNYGEGALYLVASGTRLEDDTLFIDNGAVRIASEYPNLAERVAALLRLERFSIFPLWGAAEGYPPENAELVLLPRKTDRDITETGLVPLARLLNSKACLIANATSLKTKDMAWLLDTIAGSTSDTEDFGEQAILGMTPLKVKSIGLPADENLVKLALPDGHQQAHVRKILAAAGITVEEYPSMTGNRRPDGPEGFFIKVIRPQDMPLQVANGNFDLAITGRDWLTDHIYQFPTSPVAELLDLKYGWVRIVAVVDKRVPASDLAEFIDYRNGREEPCRVASEYINIADTYSRNNHLGQYRIIPTWGSTEAFLPEDADLLIENTETGSTIARHELKIIDTLFESTACVIGRNEPAPAVKQDRINWFLDALKQGLGVGHEDN
jgi:ATP phosphoribosyltransferase